MSKSFVLDPRIESSTAEVATWPLCSLRLKDDARFHWLLLMPRRPDVTEFTDLSAEDYDQLSTEILAATKVVQEVARPDKINVAMIGNLVPQMHIHVLGRFTSDAAWPGPVWSAGQGPTFPPHALMVLVERYAKAAERLRPA